MTYRFEPLSEELLWEFLATIREEDLREVEAGGNTLATLCETLKDLMDSPLAPEQLMAMLTEQGTLLAVGGIHPIVPDSVGAPWFLCTHRAKANPKVLLKGLRHKALLWAEMYPYQTHKMWALNTLHASLVRRLGYTIEPEVDAKGFAMFYKGVLPHV